MSGLQHCNIKWNKSDTYHIVSLTWESQNIKIKTQNLDIKMQGDGFFS